MCKLDYLPIAIFPERKEDPHQCWAVIQGESTYQVVNLICQKDPKTGGLITYHAGVDKLLNTDNHNFSSPDLAEALREAQKQACDKPARHTGLHCLTCDARIFSEHVYDFRWCECPKDSNTRIAVDGGLDYSKFTCEDDAKYKTIHRSL